MKTIGSHYGMCLLYPPNTMLAYQKAVEAGVTAVQVPVQLTSDGYIICMHDTTVDATTDGTGTIADLNWSYISGLDAGYRFSVTAGGGYPYRGLGLTVPLFTDVLAEFKDQPVWIYAYDVNAGTTDLANAVYKAVQDAGMLSQVIFMFENATANLLSKYGNTIIASMHIWQTYSDSAATKYQCADVLYGHKIKAINLTEGLNADYISFLHSLGMLVRVSSLSGTDIDYKAQTKLYLDAGADIIFGEDPIGMLEAFDEAGIVQTLPPPNGYYFRNNRNYDFV